ncbi:MAG TPA: response regulator transcription factor [Pyrinomonadaceae bacterium]|jgi:DNA-binding response OmpR family regulator
MKILIVEDEEHLAEGLRFNLEAEGYEVSIAADGEAGIEQLASGDFNAVVLDVMLPGISGFEVAHKMREEHDYTPILMLTARSRPEDVLLGFESGADDYLPKPFDLQIILARLNGLLRRQKWSRTSDAKGADVVEINGRTIDLVNLELRNNDDVVPITLMEAKLLRYLIDNEGRVVSRKSILEDVWQLQEDTDTRAIDNFIVRLRRYLEDSPNDPKVVLTVRGVGYKYVKPV